jgi:hypothetical protein
MPRKTAHELLALREICARCAAKLVRERVSQQATMDPEKLIFWLMRWGWRGPATLALVVLGIWLYSLWKY